MSLPLKFDQIAPRHSKSANRKTNRLPERKLVFQCVITSSKVLASTIAVFPLRAVMTYPLDSPGISVPKNKLVTLYNCINRIKLSKPRPRGSPIGWSAVPGLKLGPAGQRLRAAGRHYRPTRPARPIGPAACHYPLRVTLIHRAAPAGPPAASPVIAAIVISRAVRRSSAESAASADRGHVAESDLSLHGLLAGIAASAAARPQRPGRGAVPGGSFEVMTQGRLDSAGPDGVSEGPNVRHARKASPCRIALWSQSSTERHSSEKEEEEEEA